MKTKVVFALSLVASSCAVAPRSQTKAATESKPENFVEQLFIQLEQDKAADINFSEKSGEILAAILKKSTGEYRGQFGASFTQEMRKVKRNEPKVGSSSALTDQAFKSEDYSAYGAAIIAGSVDAAQYNGSYFGPCVIISLSDIKMDNVGNCLLIAKHDITINKAERSTLIALNQVTVVSDSWYPDDTLVVAKEVSNLAERKLKKKTVADFVSQVAESKGTSIDTLNAFLAKKSNGLMRGKETSCNYSQPESCNDTYTFSDGTALREFRSNKNISYVLFFSDASYAIVNKDNSVFTAYSSEGKPQ